MVEDYSRRSALKPVTVSHPVLKTARAGDSPVGSDPTPSTMISQDIEDTPNPGQGSRFSAVWAVVGCVRCGRTWRGRGWQQRAPATTAVVQRCGAGGRQQQQWFNAAVRASGATAATVQRGCQGDGNGSPLLPGTRREQQQRSNAVVPTTATVQRSTWARAANSNNGPTLSSATAQRRRPQPKVTGPAAPRGRHDDAAGARVGGGGSRGRGAGDGEAEG